MERGNAKYLHALRAVYERPWAIAQNALDEIVAQLMLAASGQIERADFDALSRTPQSDRPRNPAIAVLSIRGIISQQQGLLGLLLGGTSVDSIAREFRAAMTDKQIDGIVLDINSPGGTVDGVEELATMIRGARGERNRKPIVAVANGAAESAAYWIASAADEVVVTPSGSVGSIGVFHVHQDISAAAAMEGIKSTVIKYGKYKMEDSPFEPLSDEARTQLQSRVDYFGRMFDRAVAKGRNVPVEKVRAEFGQGRSFPADDAVRLGLADRQETLNETIVRVAREGVQSPVAIAAISESSVTAVLAGTPTDDDAALPVQPQTEPQVAAQGPGWKRVRTALAIAELT